MYTVVFLNESGTKVSKRFDSPYFCRKFVEKMRRSKRCKLLYYPIFD